MKTIHRALPLLLLLLAPAAQAQLTGWFQPPRASTEPFKDLFDLTFDTEQRRVVYVGAHRNSTQYSYATWNGTAWSIRSTPVSVRGIPAIAYDSDRKRLVLFDGALTWEFDGASWSQVASSNPSPRNGARMVYDQGRKAVVLVGGYQLNDAWVWDGRVWTRIATTGRQPSVLSLHAMAYDAARGNIVAYNGVTWILDQTGWRLAGNASGPLSGSFMAYDTVAERIVMYGWRGTVRETWTWNGTIWARAVNQTNNPTVWSAAMAFDAERREVVMFANVFGAPIPSETWVYRSEFPRAGVATFGAGCGGAELISTGSPVPGGSFTLTARGFAMSAPIGLLAAGLSKERIGALQLPFDLSTAGMPGCMLYQSMEIVLPLALAQGSATRTVNVPNLPGLRGTALHFQAAAGSKATNAGTVLVGLR